MTGDQRMFTMLFDQHGRLDNVTGKGRGDGIVMGERPREAACARWPGRRSVGLAGVTR